MRWRSPAGVVVEAVQWRGDNLVEMDHAVGSMVRMDPEGPGQLELRTFVGGQMRWEDVPVGAWIVWRPFTVEHTLVTADHFAAYTEVEG